MMRDVNGPPRGVSSSSEFACHQRPLLEVPSASAFVTAHIDRRYESDALKRTTGPPRA
jgi:hypothetical protein